VVFHPQDLQTMLHFPLCFPMPLLVVSAADTLASFPLPLSACVGLITTIATAPNGKATTAATSTSASTTASSLGEFGLGHIYPISVNRLGAFRDAMMGITAIETCINTMFLWNIPLI
jgi:hypothetical protein